MGAAMPFSQLLFSTELQLKCAAFVLLCNVTTLRSLRHSSLVQQSYEHSAKMKEMQMEALLQIQRKPFTTIRCQPLAAVAYTSM